MAKGKAPAKPAPKKEAPKAAPKAPPKPAPKPEAKPAPKVEAPKPKQVLSESKSSAPSAKPVSKPEAKPQAKPQDAPKPSTAFEITQNFGQESEYDVFSGGINYGVDIGTPPNTEVTLPAGKWEIQDAFSGADPLGGSIGDDTNQGYGNSVVARNAETGETMRFSHLGNVNVEPGQVLEGGVIGTTGASGNVTGPHLDVEYYDAQGQIADVLQSPYAGMFGELKPSSQPLESRPSQGIADGFVEGTPDEYKSIISKAAQEHGLDTGILSALLKQESGFNPTAQSPVGATGIAQFMPATAERFGIDPLDPNQAIPAAAKYVKSNLDTFGSMDLALAAYNAGEGAVQEYGGVPPYPETQNYVKNILGSAATALSGPPPQTPIPPMEQLTGVASVPSEIGTPLPQQAPQMPQDMPQAIPPEQQVRDGGFVPGYNPADYGGQTPPIVQEQQRLAGGNQSMTPAPYVSTPTYSPQQSTEKPKPPSPPPAPPEVVSALVEKTGDPRKAMLEYSSMFPTNMMDSLLGQPQDPYISDYLMTDYSEDEDKPSMKKLLGL